MLCRTSDSTTNSHVSSLCGVEQVTVLPTVMSAACVVSKTLHPCLNFQTWKKSSPLITNGSSAWRCHIACNSVFDDNDDDDDSNDDMIIIILFLLLLTIISKKRTGVKLNFLVLLIHTDFHYQWSFQKRIIGEIMIIRDDKSSPSGTWITTDSTGIALKLKGVQRRICCFEPLWPGWWTQKSKSCPSCNLAD